MDPIIPRPRQRSSTFTFCVLFLALAVSTACGTSEPPAGEDSVTAGQAAANEVKRFQLRGKVVRLENDNQAAVIQHGEIVGWMDAMTMRFPIKEKADWEKLSVGREIEATVFVTDDGFYVGDIKPGDAAAVAPPQQQ